MAELLTVFLVGPLCLWMAYAVFYRRPYRYVLFDPVSLHQRWLGAFWCPLPSDCRGSLV